MAESILDAAPEELQSAAAKITYLGEQSKPIGSVIFYSRGHQPVIEDFLSIQAKGRLYTNDKSPYTSQFAVEPDEFRRMLVAAKPLVTSADVAGTRQFLSFSVMRKANVQIVGHEFHVGVQSCRKFYAALISALNEDNSSGRAIMQKQSTAVCH